MERHDKEWMTQIGQIERKWAPKRHTLAKFNQVDVAEACGISIRTLQRYCSFNDIDLTTMSLTKLVDLVIKIRARVNSVRLGIPSTLPTP